MHIDSTGKNELCQQQLKVYRIEEEFRSQNQYETRQGSGLSQTSHTVGAAFLRVGFTLRSQSVSQRSTAFSVNIIEQNSDAFILFDNVEDLLLIT